MDSKQKNHVVQIKKIQASLIKRWRGHFFNKNFKQNICITR